jgi:ribosomal protein S18 acetylase RimI-like enzyme
MDAPRCITPVNPASDPIILAELIRLLCRAFNQDPHINWIVRQDKHRASAFEALFRLLLTDLTEARGEILASTDLKVVAICFPPGQTSMSLHAQASLGLRFASITGWMNLPVRTYGLNRMEHRHPPTPHIFVQTIGVDPDHQGQGYGTAMLTEILAKSHRLGIPTYLETCRETNLGFYERLGFRVMAEHKLPHGPRLWQLIHGVL